MTSSGRSRRCSILDSSSHYIFEKRPQSREAIGGIDVMLDDVKREVIRAGETPDGDGKKKGNSEAGNFNKNRGRGDQASKQEKKSLQIDDAWVGQVHGGLFAVTSIRRLLSVLPALAPALEEGLLALFDGGVGALGGENSAVAGVVVAIFHHRGDALQLRGVRLLPAGEAGGAGVVDRLPAAHAQVFLLAILDQPLALALLDVTA